MTVDPSNVPGYLAVLMCIAFAVWLWRTGTRGSTARQLAVLLAIEGLAVGTSGIVRFGWAIPQVVDDAMSLLHHVGDLALFALYPAFLANALRTRWTAAFATAPARIAFGVLAIAIFGFIFGLFETFDKATANVLYSRRVWFLYVTMSVLFAWAFVVSIHAWRVADTVNQRRRARAFAIGFGIRDVCWCIGFGYLAYVMYLIPVAAKYSPIWWLYPLGTLIEVPLIAYGILSAHLFDIDLKVKWTISRSTLAAMVIAIIYFATEAADRLLSNELGAWPGLVAAALIMYFLAPLQRVAERFANRAMPETVNSPEYRAFRKLQVYEAALAEALAGDDISAKERAILAALADSLGVSSDDARAIEADLRARLSSNGIGAAVV